MLVARVVSGIGMGFVNSTVPVIQAEFSPKSSRGRFVCMQLSTLNFGKSYPATSLISHRYTTLTQLKQES
jgi:MFS family permease